MVNCVSPIPNEMFSDYVRDAQRGLARRKCRQKRSRPARRDCPALMVEQARFSRYYEMPKQTDWSEKWLNT